MLDLPGIGSVECPAYLDRLTDGHAGDNVDDLQIAWLMIGWLVAFWAGKDLQTRFTQWRSARVRVRLDDDRRW